MYRAIDIAKYVVTKCVRDSHPISNLRLQEILYYLQKKYINIGSQLFGDPIEAWKFGPVVPDVYYKFCGSGARTILLTYETSIADADKKIMDSIIEDKRNKEPWELVEDTHKEGGAWYQTYHYGTNREIQINLIRDVG